MFLERAAITNGLVLMSAAGSSSSELGWCTGSLKLNFDTKLLWWARLFFFFFLVFVLSVHLLALSFKIFTRARHLSLSCANCCNSAVAI